jgi:hypothetical protein
MKIQHRDQIGELLNFYNLNGKGVEVGTWKGDFAKIILKSWNGTLYMVDPWRGLGEEYDDSSNMVNDAHANAYHETMNSIKGYENRAFMLRGLSNELVNLFQDDSLDFVYIDGNHAYDFVVEDINLWFPKVKKGGLVMGHDYILFGGTKEGWYLDPNFAENGKDKFIWSGDGKTYGGKFGVNPAVDEFCEQNGYEVIHTVDEWCSSWYFVK